MPKRTPRLGGDFFMDEKIVHDNALLYNGCLLRKEGKS